jgi:F-type H+-transporting ATPase subunit epsilon
MSELKIKFKIVTPERTVYEENIDQATLPALSGQITILPNHRSYIGALKAGEIMLKQAGQEINLAISSGLVEFNQNTLVILADTAEQATEIDIARAEATARERAEAVKKEKTIMSEQEYARVAASIEKELVRIKVARKHHTKHGISIN